MSRSAMLMNLPLAVAFLVLALSISPSSSAPVYALTASDISAMESSITTAFGLSASYGRPCNPCAQGDNIGALVRLAFHDSFGNGGPLGKGGMNGCIDFNTPDHKGLETVVGQLDQIYTPFASKISKADFWLLAANLAVRYATTTPVGGPPRPPGIPDSPGTLVLPFRYGRPDDATCNDFGRLPMANFSWAQMAAEFVTRVGLSVPQFVALMGAHSLGRAEFKNSGFEGGWTIAQSTLSTLYFSSLGGVKWNNTNASDVWLDVVPKPETLMLTVDVEPLFSPSKGCPVFLNFNGGPGPNGGGCTRNRQTGNPSDSVQYYATNSAAFFANFSEAWKIMSEYGQNNLQSFGGNQIAGSEGVAGLLHPLVAVAMLLLFILH